MQTFFIACFFIGVIVIIYLDLLKLNKNYECPKCQGQNTKKSRNGDICHCWDCDHKWR